MNPYEGGDVHLIPLNMVAVGTEPAEPEAEPETNAAPEPETRAVRATPTEIRRDRQRLARSYLPAYEDVATRLVRRETNDIRRAVDKFLRRRSIPEFTEWLDEFYADFQAIVERAFTPIMATYADQVLVLVAAELDAEVGDLDQELRDWIGGYLEIYASQWAASRQNQINAIIRDSTGEAEDAADLIDDRLVGWNETQPSKEALGQVFEASNALAVAAYGLFGITQLIWQASGGDSCPFCNGLHGTVVGIEDNFVEAETELDQGEAGTMVVRRSKRYGPLHRGCDCVVVAVRA
jgi:hypothetical protein